MWDGILQPQIGSQDWDSCAKNVEELKGWDIVVHSSLKGFVYFFVFFMVMITMYEFFLLLKNIHNYHLHFIWQNTLLNYVWLDLRLFLIKYSINNAIKKGCANSEIVFFLVNTIYFPCLTSTPTFPSFSRSTVVSTLSPLVSPSTSGLRVRSGSRRDSSSLHIFFPLRWVWE